MMGYPDAARKQQELSLKEQPKNPLVQTLLQDLKMKSK